MFFVISSVSAQDAVKLKTVRTEYGVFVNSKFNSMGNLDGAVINPDSVSILATQMYIVNTSKDTFKGTDKFRQVMIFYPYSSNGELLTEPDFNESNIYPFVNDLLPGDTVCFGTMRFRFSDIRDAVGENTWNQISYWKIVTGINYTSVDGIYSDSVLFAGADTCTFRVMSSDGVPHVTAAQSLSVYPNPATSQVMVRVSDPAALNGELTLTNMLGEVVCRRTITNAETPISLQGMANGMYIAVYRSSAGIQQFRFVKE